MAINKFLLGFSWILAIATAWIILAPQNVSASVFDGKACAVAPLYFVEECPPGYGVEDLTAAQIIVIPSGSECYDPNDPLGEDTTKKSACNYDTDPGEEASLALAASTLRDDWMQRWKDDNPGQGEPTEGEWMRLVNETVATELAPPPDTEDPELDCSGTQGYDQIRCEAVKACEDAGESDCAGRFDTCMDGSTDEDTAATCAEEIAPEEDESLCQVEGGMGWLLCPILNTVAGANGAMYSVIEVFLATPPLISRGDSLSSNPAYSVWSIMRTIANVLFVIGFLFIIMSQTTNIGITNYGIKKMLPKLIIGAILVNTSFWIVALSIDISNVAGASIYNVMTDIGFDAAETPQDSDDPHDWIGVITLLLLGAGAVYMVLFSTLFPLAVGALLTFAVLMFALVFRHAAVFILAAASPVLIAMYLLPNTQGIFRKATKLFYALLLMHPVASFCMGASNIAAMIIFAEGFDMFQATDGSDSNKLVGGLFVIAGMIMPAAGVILAILVLKTVGAIGGKLGIANPFGNMIGAAKKRAGDVGKGIDDAQRNDRRARALKFANKNRNSESRVRRAGAFVAGVRGGGVGDYLKNRGKTLESDYESARTEYNEDGGVGGWQKADQRQMRENRIVTSAAENASKQDDLEEFANKTDSEIAEMANGSDDMKKALTSQRAAAISQAASGLASQYDSIEIPALGDELVAAVKEGDAVRTQAITRKLAESGGAGASKLRDVYATLDGEAASGGLNDEKHERAYTQMAGAIRNSSVKARAADVYEHSIQNGVFGEKAMDIGERADEKSVWTKLSDSEIASQTPGGIGKAIARGDIDNARIKQILANPSATASGNAETIKLLQSRVGPARTSENTASSVNVDPNKQRTTVPTLSGGEAVSPGGIIIPGSLNKTQTTQQAGPAQTTNPPSSSPQSAPQASTSPSQQQQSSTQPISMPAGSNPSSSQPTSAPPSSRQTTNQSTTNTTNNTTVTQNITGTSSGQLDVPHQPSGAATPPKPNLPGGGQPESPSPEPPRRRNPNDSTQTDNATNDNDS